MVDERGIEWQYRRSTESKWHAFPKALFEEGLSYFEPIGFGEDLDELLVLDSNDQRISLFSIDLNEDGATELVYAHPDVDLANGVHLGRDGRLVGVQYATDTVHTHYFDPAIEKIRNDVGAVLPGQAVDVIGESWDRRYYLVRTSSDRDPGHYYRFDVRAREMLQLPPRRPLLEGRLLAAMTPVRHTSEPGHDIPAYLTLPPGPVARPLPAVILPHGGPQSRDVWGFDWLAQFFAARGFAVLQSNFRGSGGFGIDWAGEGGFRAWRLAISDIDQGARWLIDEGIADPDRLCVVGWSYGGYAALMSAIEHPSRYRCVVSIAGVTDPRRLIEDNRSFVGSAAVEEFISRHPDVLERGSAVRRAEELTAPLLLVHGDEDVNVSVDQSRHLERALRNEKKSVELIEFDDAEHSIWNSGHRIRMLERIGAFVEDHTRPPVARSTPAPTTSEGEGRDAL